MKLAVVTNKPYKNCETFIKAQIDLLPFEMVHYWGKVPPFNCEIPKKNLATKAINKLVSQPVSKIDFFAKELIASGVSAVLAQYGMIGANVLPSCKKANLPLIVHFHGHDAVRHSVLENFKQKYSEMFSYEKTTVVSVSNEMTKRLIAIGCPEEKIVYNTYGPNDLFLDLKPTYSKEQFVSIGRFTEKKAPHITLLAFSKVLSEFPNARLIYAGDGPLLDSCKDLSEALNINNNVSFPGRITPNEYRDLLTQSLAYVQHSVEAKDGDMEGTPVSILEASGAGLAIVSTVHAGIPDVIVHRETGLLGEERDADTMAKNMQWILQNKEETKIMGANGKTRIRDNYSMKHHIDRLATIVKNAVN
tara:strand:+ start:86617 stop:87699 length:1083 start_codon:yes stop_codon:yes gene_type:complete